MRGMRGGVEVEGLGEGGGETSTGPRGQQLQVRTGSDRRGIGNRG